MIFNRLCHCEINLEGSKKYRKRLINVIVKFAEQLIAKMKNLMLSDLLSVKSAR